MTKADLINAVAAEKRISKGRAELLVNHVFDCIEGALRRNDRVEILGFGSFETRRYAGYQGRNPRTGAAVSVKPKRLPFFKVGKELRELVNGEVSRTQDLPSVEPPLLRAVH